MKFNKDVFYLHWHFGWKNSFWLKSRNSQMPQQRRALFSDESSQTDTLNPTQVQSSASAHVASTWTDLKRIKRTKPKEQKKLTRLWVTYWCVLCLWELAWLLIFTSHVCMYVCICYGNIIHISNSLLISDCWLRFSIAPHSLQWLTQLQSDPPPTPWDSPKSASSTNAGRLLRPNGHWGGIHTDFVTANQDMQMCIHTGRLLTYLRYEPSKPTATDSSQRSPKVSFS